MKNKQLENIKSQELVNFIYTRLKQGYDKNEILKEIEKKWRS